MTLMFRLAAVAVCTLIALASGAAQAKPYTLHFEGVVGEVYNYATNTSAYSGEKFSGHVTWDSGLSEYYSDSEDDGLNVPPKTPRPRSGRDTRPPFPFHFAYTGSNSGCFFVTRGNCI